MVKGFDCASTVTPKIAKAFVEDGFDFVLRYLVPAEKRSWKALKKKEAQDILSAGLKLISIYEAGASNASKGRTQGFKDGQAALIAAAEVGQPLGSAIYFAVDFDAQDKHMDAIEEYLKGVKSFVGNKYSVRVYGSYKVIEEMFKRRAAEGFWQTYAWSNNKVSAHNNIYQYDNGPHGVGRVLHGIDVDLNQSSGNEGWWTIEEVAKMQIVKERIIKSGSGLKYIPIATSTDRARTYTKNSGTDIRFMVFKKGSYRTELHHGKNMKVTVEAKKAGADYGINFPYFDWNSAVVVGTVWDGSKYVNGAYGNMKEWYELAFTGGTAQIEQLSDVDIRTTDCTVQGKVLIAGGKMVWRNDGLKCQRTFVGINAAGDLLVAESDGRTDGDIGLTVEEMALYMKDKGAVYAIEGDGGGSTIFYSNVAGTYYPGDRTYAPGGINQAQNVGVNERAVHHALLFFLNKGPQQPTQPFVDTHQMTFGDIKKLKEQGFFN